MQDEARRHASLEIDEDIAFQERSWLAERIGWALMLVVIAAAILGLFSSGPLSSATARDPAARLTVDYQRFQRIGTPSLVTLRLAAAGETVDVEIARAFLETFEISGIRPRPSSETALGDGIRLRFAATPSATAAIDLHVRPTRAGIARPRLRLAGAEAAELFVLVYP